MNTTAIVLALMAVAIRVDAGGDPDRWALLTGGFFGLALALAIISWTMDECA